MTFNPEWLDHDNGEWAELILPDIRVIVSQPEDSTHDNWSIIYRPFKGSSGRSLSLASGKVDAVIALRRDIEQLVEALGGDVKWSK